MGVARIPRVGATRGQGKGMGAANGGAILGERGKCKCCPAIGLRKPKGTYQKPEKRSFQNRCSGNCTVRYYSSANLVKKKLPGSRWGQGHVEGQLPPAPRWLRPCLLQRSMFRTFQARTETRVTRVLNVAQYTL